MALLHSGRKAAFFTVFILVLLSFAINSYAQGEHPPLRFQHIGVEQGLSNSTALHMMQDSRGYIWIGTLDGLNRYNGYDFRVYTHDPDNPHSVGSNMISGRIVEDRAGTIWIGTDSGLSKFDFETERFTNYRYDDPTITDHTVYGMYEDTKGRLWIGSFHGALYRFDRETETFIPYKLASEDVKPDKIHDIVEDQAGRLWLATSSAQTD